MLAGLGLFMRGASGDLETSVLERKVRPAVAATRENYSVRQAGQFWVIWTCSLRQEYSCPQHMSISPCDFDYSVDRGLTYRRVRLRVPVETGAEHRVANANCCGSSVTLMCVGWVFQQTPMYA